MTTTRKEEDWANRTLWASIVSFAVMLFSMSTLGFYRGFIAGVAVIVCVALWLYVGDKVEFSKDGEKH